VEFEKFFPQKEHLKVLGVSVDSLPDLLRFPLGLAKHQNVVKTDRTFNVPCYDPALIASFQYPDPDLDYFACYAGPSDNLSYFSGDESVIATVPAAAAHFVPPVFLTVSIIRETSFND
jgi:hypothetical protein